MHADDEIHAAVEIGVAEVKTVRGVLIVHAVDVVHVVGFKSSMAKAKRGSRTDVRYPVSVARGARKRVEDIEVDPEEGGELAHPDLHSRPKRQTPLEDRANREIGRASCRERV